MLRKIFGAKRGPNNLPLSPILSLDLAKPVGQVKRRSSSAMKIVHPGGRVERYYMAVPAQRIIEKYPNFILARPEIFRRPWDSIVQPNEVLVPGQKYYIVPCNTVKKLRRKIKMDHDPGFSYDSRSWGKSISGSNHSLSISGILLKPRPKVRALNLHVKFKDEKSISPKFKPDQISKFSNKKSRNDEEKHSKKEQRIPRHTNGKLRRAQNENAWTPSLTSIIE